MGDDTPEKEKKADLALAVKVDIAGAKELAEIGTKVTDASLKGAEATVRSLFKPAADTTGMLLRDIVAGWQERNFIRSMAKTQKLLDDLPNGDRLRAHPRLLHLAINQTSLTDDDTLQDMWASLIVSSSSDSAPEEHNLVYMNILRDLDAATAKLLKVARRVTKRFTDTGPSVTLGRRVPVGEIRIECGFKGDDHLIASMMLLKRLDLLNIGCHFEENDIILIATSLGSHLCDLCDPPGDPCVYASDGNIFKQGGWYQGSQVIWDKKPFLKE